MMSSRYQLSRDEDDGLTCRLCLQAFWFKDELRKHLTDVHSFTEKDQEEERRRNAQRIMEQRRRIALAQQQRMQAAMASGAMRGGIMRGRGSGISVSPGMVPRPKFSFQYHDGGFICELCKKKFSDGNDMVKHWRTHNSQRGRGAPASGRGRGRGRPPVNDGSSSGRGRGRGRKKSEKTLRREERQRKKEEKAKRRASSKRPQWTPYLMWSTRKRKKIMAKHPEMSFAEVSKAISEGWKEVTMEEVERLEEEVFCLNERSKFKAKGKAYWTAFKLWSKRMRKEILEEHPAWTDYAVESALERNWKTVKKEEIDVLEDQVALLGENNDEKVEKGNGNFNAFLCWSIKKMKNIQANIPNWSDIQIGKSITDGWQEIEKEEIEGLDFEAFCYNEKVSKRIRKRSKGPGTSMETDDDDDEEEEEEIGDDEEWDPFILKLKQVAKFIVKLETMEEQPELESEHTETDEEPQKEDADENKDRKTNGNDGSETIGTKQKDAQLKEQSQTDDNEENKTLGTGENQTDQKDLDDDMADNELGQTHKDIENDACNNSTQEPQTINSDEMMAENSDNNAINTEASKSEESNTKDPMDKGSMPSLTQSTLDNDVLEDLFQDKSIDNATDDSISKDLPL